MTDRHHVELHALDGLEPLGFLAALGVLHLLAHRGVDARLSFDPTLATARLAGVENLEEVVDHLVALVEALPPDGLMVGMPPDLLPKKTGSKGGDPARLTPASFAAAAAAATDASSRAWVRALWTDLALKEGRCEFTPFSAPSGQQTLRSMFEKPAEDVRAAPRQRLDEALRSWRRIDGVTGENLDRRAVKEAAEQPDGKATKMGVPGPTWLALSALPLFPMGGDGRHPRTRRWSRLRARDGRTRLTFSWPVWRQDLDLAALHAMLAHPAIDDAAALAAAGSTLDVRARGQLDALGVERVSLARRWVPPGSNAAGVLVPAGSWS